MLKLGRFRAKGESESLIIFKLQSRISLISFFIPFEFSLQTVWIKQLKPIGIFFLDKKKKTLLKVKRTYKQGDCNHVSCL